MIGEMVNLQKQLVLVAFFLKVNTKLAYSRAVGFRCKT